MSIAIVSVAVSLLISLCVVVAAWLGRGVKGSSLPVTRWSRITDRILNTWLTKVAH